MPDLPTDSSLPCGTIYADHKCRQRRIRISCRFRCCAGLRREIRHVCQSARCLHGSHSVMRGNRSVREALWTARPNSGMSVGTVTMI